jgi:transcriptional regulator with XRE-family HTH domain
MRTPEAVTKAVATELRAAVGRKNLSRRGLATDMGVSPQWVWRRLSGEQSLTVADVVLICEAMDLDPLTVLEPALGPAKASA